MTHTILNFSTLAHEQQPAAEVDVGAIKADGRRFADPGNMALPTLLGNLGRPDIGGEVVAVAVAPGVVAEDPLDLVDEVGGGPGQERGAGNALLVRQDL